MPDGHVFEAVPDGVSDEQIYARWLKMIEQRSGGTKRRMVQMRLNQALGQKPPAPAEGALLPHDVAGFGLNAYDTVLGMGQSMEELGDHLKPEGHPDIGVRAAQLAEQRKALELPIASARQEAPVTTAVGGGAPYAVLPPAKSAAGQMAGNAALTFATQPGTLEDRAKNAALTALGTGVVNKLMPHPLARSLTGRNNKMTGRQAELARLWQQKGGRIAPSGMRDFRNSGMENLEQRLRRNWYGEDAMAKIDEANALTLNRAVTKEMGRAADKVDDVYLAERTNRAKRFFNEALAGDVPRPGAVIPDLDDALKVAKRNLKNVGGAKSLVTKMKREIAEAAKNGEPITAENWAGWHSRARQDALSAYKAGSESLGDGYALLADALEKRLQAGMSPKQAAKLSEARKIWRVMDDVLPAINHKHDIVSAKKLAARLRKKYKDGFERGRKNDDYFETVRAAEKFGVDDLPNSGTPGGLLEGQSGATIGRTAKGSAIGGAADVALGLPPGTLAVPGGVLGGLSVPAQKAYYKWWLSPAAEAGALTGRLGPANAQAVGNWMRAVPERMLVPTVPPLRSKYEEHINGSR